MSAPWSLLLALSLSLGSIFYNLWSRTRRLHGLDGPDSPSFFLGHVVDLRRAPLGTRWNVWQRKYGATYRVMGVLLEPLLVLGDPRGATHVLTTNVDNYPRPDIDKIILEGWFGRAVFSADGEEHRAMRKMLNPAFTLQSVKTVSPTFFDLARQVVSDWENNILNSGLTSTVFDVKKSINLFSLDAISMTMFAYKISSTSPGQRSIPDILNSFSTTEAMTTGAALAGILLASFPSLAKLPNPKKAAATDLRLELTRIAREVWGHSSMDRIGEARILEMMDERREQGMSENEAIAQIVALLFAGSETTANVLSEILYELALNSSVQDRLREELRSAAADQGTEQLSFDSIMSAESLPYLDAVVRESMRLKAVLMEITRSATADDQIPLEFPLPDGTRSIRVQAGQEIMIPVREGLNINPEIWGADAEQFRPERWIETVGSDDHRELIRAQHNVFTFGDGPRVCLGRIFALVESKILIATLIQTFKFEPVEGVDFVFYHLGGNTVKPKIRDHEAEGVQLPLRVSVLST